MRRGCTNNKWQLEREWGEGDVEKEWSGFACLVSIVTVCERGKTRTICEDKLEDQTNKEDNEGEQIGLLG